MLNWLKIKNLALIAKSEVEFAPGFNVITGETGAGKSVLLSTINLLLGARADKNIIRSGEDCCEICGSFALTPKVLQTLQPLLQQASIPCDEESGELQIRRSISRTATKNLVNDTPVMLQTLKMIGALLVDVHAASEQQSLFSTAYQLELIDRYAHLDELSTDCKKFYIALKALRAARDLAFKEMPAALEAEHLRAAIEEISSANLEPDEDKLLTARHKIAANAKDIIEQTLLAEQILTESDNSLSTQLTTVYRSLQEIADSDAEYGGKMLDMCGQLTDQLNDLGRMIGDYRGRVELDEREFTELENRINLIQRLKRRYGPALENVFEYKQHAEARLQMFENAEQKRAEFDADEEQIRVKLHQSAEKLSIARKNAVAKMLQKIIEKMKKLGLPDGTVDIAFQTIEAGESGMDRIELLFSANPGEPVKPLREIASSGEISRVMLALKTVLAEADTIPILVFDEIDVNIGGKTANHVGRELVLLSKNHQILCISHLAQVAVCSTSHYSVQKEVISKHTYSKITKLNEQARAMELARMLGGGAAAEKHAAAMINDNS